MTRIRVLAVMLVTTLVATHSHSPWSSLLRDRNCKLPLGRMLCLLLLGFPTFNGHGNYSDMVKKWKQTFQRIKTSAEDHLRGGLLWCVFLLNLSPVDGWYVRVSRGSTGDNKLSPRLLTVLPPRSHVKVRGILEETHKHQTHHEDFLAHQCTLRLAADRSKPAMSDLPLAPNWQGGTCPWYPGRCKAYRCRCPGSLLWPPPPGYFRLVSGSNQGTTRQGTIGNYQVNAYVMKARLHIV